MGLEYHIVTFEGRAVAKASHCSVSRWAFNPSLFCLDVARNDGYKHNWPQTCVKEKWWGSEGGLGASSHPWHICFCIPIPVTCEVRK